MANILVSVISEHLIPNYHLYMHLKDEVDEHLLITTKEVKVNADYFERYLGHERPVKRIEIDATNFQRIQTQLHEFSFEKDDLYLVNLTGGTKMISIAVFSVFAQLNAEMYYIAIGTNSCRKVYPEQGPIRPFAHRLSLEEYLGLYGFEVEKTNALHKSVKHTRELFGRVAERQYQAMADGKIRQALEQNTCKPIEDLDYYRGLWFEEYMYDMIKEELNLKDAQIGLNVKVRKFKEKGLNDNEFDVVFVKNNRLYVVECKSSVGKKKEYRVKMESFLYKLGAAVKDFGLQVTPILAVCAPANVSVSINERADILGIILIGAEMFDNKVLLDRFIKML